MSETDARGIAVTRTVDALDRVTTVTYPSPDLDVSYTYDDPAVSFSKGRLTRIVRNGVVVDYRYDRFGRILQDGELSYGYDANGNPVSLVYPGGVEAVTTFDFADRPASLLARRQLDLDDGTEIWRYLATDHLGTPIAATNTIGSLLWHGGFEPFGADWSGAGEAGVFLRFPGQWEERSLANTGFGLYDNVNRYYEPSTGTYTKADPIGLEGGLNLYVYAFSSPLMHSDPLGLASFLCRRPLGDRKPKPGNTRIGPDIWGNPLYHQYVCVVNGSVAHCGGHC